MFSIEKGTLDDIVPICNLINDCFVGDNSSLGWASVSGLIGGLRITPKRLQAQISSPDVTLYKCYDKLSGEVAGICLARQEGDVMWSEMLCVSPKVQGKGIGKALVQQVEELAITCGCTSHKIDVFSCRQEIINWYERMGFRINGKIAKFPDPHQRDWFPKLELQLIEMEKFL